MIIRILLLTLIAIGGGRADAQQQRDAPPTAASGTSRIYGTVISDEAKPSPIRRAIISLSNGRDVNRATTSDESGGFVFENLPAGRFAVTATKGGYIPAAYGAVAPGGQGISVAVADGSVTNGLKIALTRGAVITGVLRDERGKPLEGVRVTASRPNAVFDDPNGTQSSSSSTTDDRGVYRIFALKPGSYLVYAEPPLWVEAGITRTTTREDLQLAQRVIDSSRTGGGPASRSGNPTGLPVSYARSFYPSTVSPNDATPVRLAAGEERGGIDLRLLLVPTARLSGRVVGVSGQAVNNPRVWIRVAGAIGTRRQFELRSAPDGTFSVASLQPGQYELGAEGRTDTDRTQWARLIVPVAGQDQSDLVLQLQPGLTVSGRVVFEGDPNPPSPSSIGVTLLEADQTMFYTLPSAKPAADGSFAIPGVPAARHLIVVGELPGRLPAGWMVKSITQVGSSVDHADSPLEVRLGQEVSPLTITLTSRTTELTGTLQDAAGRPAPAFTMVAFASDTKMWGSQSRRVRTTRPGDDGKFSILNLPAGEYFLAAVTGIEDGQSNDATFLSSLIPAAARFTVADGQRIVQDLKIR